VGYARAVNDSRVPRGAALVAALDAVAPAERDPWIDARLGFAPPPPDGPELPRGGVPYLPCGVAELVAFAREAPVGEDDVFVDVGAGLGRAAVIAHLLSGARAVGVEIQAPLVAAARARAAALGVSDAVTFVHADAADIDVDGSRYFLYAPCNGALLARVLDRLAAAARRRAIVVGAVDVVLDAPWLVARAASPSAALAIYDATRESIGTPASARLPSDRG
jgi:SAM-dependent methyltransferase